MAIKLPYYIVSLSGGKDSTAMLLRLLKENRPVDEIIFCDTGLEFPDMYAHLDKLEEYIGRPITRIKASMTLNITSAMLRLSVGIPKNSVSSSARILMATGGWGRKCGGVPID